MAKKFLVNIDLDNNKVTNSTSPTADGDLANKAYVDGVARGLKWKDSVRARATGNITIATLNNGDVIDGVTLATGDRVLLDSQSTAAQDGIYVVAASEGSTARSLDLASGVNATGVAVTVTEGTVNGDKAFIQTADPAVVNTDGLTFTQLGGSGTTYTAGAGMTESPAGTFNTVAADSSLIVGSDDIAVQFATDPGLELSTGLRVKLDGSTLTRGAAGLKVTTPVDSTVARVFTEVGSGTSSTHTMTHNLGKQWVVGACYLISTEEEVQVDIVATDTNTTTFTFGASVDKSLYRFVVVG